MKKVFCLLLCLVIAFSLLGCADKKDGQPQEKNSKIQSLEKRLTNLYSAPTEYFFENTIEKMDLITQRNLENDMSEMLGGTVKLMNSKEIFKVGDYGIYAVFFAFDFSTGERRLYCDYLATCEKEGKLIVAVQNTLPKEVQENIISTLEAKKEDCEKFIKSSLKGFCKNSAGFNEWYEKRKEVISVLSSHLSIKNEVQIFESVYERDGRTLVWSEEFENAKSLSDTKMTYKRTMNNPSLLITTDDSNLSFEDGTMTMYARPTENKKIYSIPDGITTYQSMAYVGGYLEMRAKVPFEHGAWPSFWEKSYPGMYAETDYMAEIDIFEVFAKETELSCNLHKWGVEHYQGGVGTGKTYSFPSNEIATDWHTYGFEWTDTEYRFYIDGECYSILYVDDEHDFAQQIPGMQGFQDYHYVILNCFIFNEKSSWAPDGKRLSNDETKEIKYTVDYIRLYQNKDDKLIVYK